MSAAITGFGVVSALGRGTGELWSAMAAGEDGLRPILRFPSDDLDRPLCGMVSHINQAPLAADPLDLCVELAIEAGREALGCARLDGVPPERVALVVGTSPAEADVRLYTMTARIGEALGAHGPRLTVSTACTSSRITVSTPVSAPARTDVRSPSTRRSPPSSTLVLSVTAARRQRSGSRSSSGRSPGTTR